MIRASNEAAVRGSLRGSLRVHAGHGAAARLAYQIR